MPAAAHDDPALEALMMVVDDGRLGAAPPGPQLFLRARAGPALGPARGRDLVCEQGFAPFAQALERDGFEVVAQAQGRFARVLLLPTRQRDEARALLARAVDLSAPGGVVIASVANNAGARSAQEDFERLLGPAQVVSKHKCRVFWAVAGDATWQSALLSEWRSLDAPRPILDGRFLSRPGLFAWDRIDAASALLAACLPAGLAGRAADLGAGFGYLSVELLERCPGITALDAYEAEARALELARSNLARFAGRVVLGFHWQDVAAGIAGGYDVVVSNPPFHQGRADQPELGQRFIAAAAAALNPGGRLWLVANRHLPYEQALSAGFAQVRMVRDEAGFKVFEAVKAGP